MMFSSNQILEVSGCIDHEGELYSALEFALKFSDDLLSFQNKTKANVKCVYQITEDGRYCIGKAYNKPENGWNEFPFDFDLDIISRIIVKHLEKQATQHGRWDGSYTKGFVMRVIPESFDDEENGIKSPDYGIVEFAPYTCFYSK